MTTWHNPPHRVLDSCSIFFCLIYSQQGALLKSTSLLFARVHSSAESHICAACISQIFQSKLEVYSGINLCNSIVIAFEMSISISTHCSHEIVFMISISILTNFHNQHVSFFFSLLTLINLDLCSNSIYLTLRSFVQN